MKNDTLTPQIRFKGFEEEWISKCFGDILISESYKSYLAEPTPNGLYPIIQQGDNPIVGYSNSSPFNEYEDVVLYGDHTTSVYKPLTPFLLSTDGLKMLKASGIIGTFLALSISTYGPKPEGYKRHFSILQTRTCCYPSNRAEQSAIGEYFRRVDELITEAEREVSRLEKMKQASLQKMFPRPGESVPEVRFADFTQQWKAKKLGELGSTYSGLSGKTREDFGHGNARFITYMNVFTNPIASSSMIEAVEQDQSQTPVKYGDILFTTSSETPDEVGMSSVWKYNIPDMYLNSFCFGYRLSQKVELDYIAYYLRSTVFRSNMKILAQGISRYNISKSQVMELPVQLPSLEEQAAIGEYFRNLDSLIDARRRRVAKLRDIKKACLDKMFAASAPNH